MALKWVDLNRPPLLVIVEFFGVPNAIVNPELNAQVSFNVPGFVPFLDESVNAFLVCKDS